ncbi:MAG: NUDIX hydrolase [Tractidigestivibacter sp.]|uniref:NUDIX hydrolase n=1 Tax=Tractidigestivibacter sp. TaxID=2847320 RepID=UPI003D8A96E1
MTPKPLSAYIKFRSKPENAQLFAPVGDYPLADLSERDAKKRVIATSEKLGQQFGIVYESQYNTLVVDPVESGEGCYPYERVVPTAGNGVVIVPRHGEKYVLLRQGRHAIRQEQLGFPRGHSELDSNGKTDVSRELSEELRATPRGDAKLVGDVTPDSGLTSSVVGIYLVDIDGYDANVGHEGIQDAVELTAEELRAKIASGEIEDGFTIAAFTLVEGSVQRA